VATVSDREKQIKSVIVVSSGNFLDMYDFMTFCYCAPRIGRPYFYRISAGSSHRRGI
jgi:hypothetical protein